MTLTKTGWWVVIVILFGLGATGFWWWVQNNPIGGDSEPPTPDWSPLPDAPPLNPPSPPDDPEVEGGGLLPSSNPINDAPNQPPLASQTINQIGGPDLAGVYYWAATGTSTTPILIQIEAATGRVVARSAVENESEVWAETELFNLHNAAIKRVDENLRLILEQKTETGLKNWLAEIIKEKDTDARQLTVRPLAENTKKPIFDPNGKQIFYLETNERGMTAWISDWKLSNKKKIWETSHRDWIASWPSAETLVLATSASQNAPGFAYLLDLKTGRLEKLLGPINGLTVSVSPDLKNILYSESQSSAPGWRLVWKQGEEIKNLPFLSWPEKCVWSGDSTQLYCGVPKLPTAGHYPDDWYLGVTAFEDEWWKVDLETGEARRLAETNGQKFDSWQPVLIAADQLHFLDKNNQTWWLANWQAGL